MNPNEQEVLNRLNLKRIWDDAYYAGRRLVTDATYDINKEEIRKLLEADAELHGKFWQEFTAISFSRLENNFADVKHDYPMLSLDKSNKVEIFFKQLQAWKAAGSKQVVVMWKVDGGSSAYRYDDTHLKMVLTRHTGEYGKDLTVTGYQIDNLPKQIPFVNHVEVRGEMVIFEADFEKANAERVAKGLDPYKNARNAAAGVSQTKDAEAIRGLHLSTVAYDVLSEDIDFDRHTDKLEWLKHQGFTVVPYGVMRTDLTIEEVREMLARWEAERFNVGYEVDGLVAAVDETEIREKLGISSGTPNFAYAFKFKDIEIDFEIDTSEFEHGIEWCFGTTGVITPRAHFKENPLSMEILGVSIRHSNLHNVAELKRIGWKAGVTHAIVKRAGLVIPKVIEAYAVQTDNQDDVPNIWPEPPSVCPCCGGQTGFKGEIFQCLNDDCDGKSFNRILRFIEAMEIDDLGETTLLKIVEDGLVKGPQDLYDLTVEQLVNLERLGESSAKKIVKNIQGSRRQPAWRVLAGLMIRGLGNTTSKVISEKWPRLSDFATNANYDDLCKLEKVGDTIATNILAGLKREEMQGIINALINKGIGEVVEEKAAPIQGALTGKTFCMTGSPEIEGQKVKKAVLQAQIEAAGGIIMDMKKGLNYLIAGPDSIAEGSNKLQKAEKIGATVISGDDVLAMIKG